MTVTATNLTEGLGGAPAQASASFGGIVNGLVAKDLTIPGANIFVDMDMITSLDPNSTSDWSQFSDGQIQYTGSRTFTALMDFNTSLELVSAATNGLRVNIMRNPGGGAIPIQSLGAAEITATQAYPNMTFIVSVVPGVIFHSEAANTSTSINIRQRTMYMRISEL